MNLRDVFAPINELFRENRIPYAVIGAYAVAAWGEVRATRDIDLLCSADDLAGIKRLLVSAGLEFEHRTGDLHDPISDVVRLQVGTSATSYEVDILAGIRGAPAGILQRARTIVVDELEVLVASPEDTIVLKLLAGSARDIEDARSILSAQAGRLDLSLIRQICPSTVRHTLEAIATVDSGG